MSSAKYIKVYSDLMNSAQRKIMGELYMKGINRDGHSWNTYGDIEDAVAELLLAQKPNIGMLDGKESADATIININTWEWGINSHYKIDQQCGAALVQEYTRLKAENKALKEKLNEKL